MTTTTRATVEDLYRVPENGKAELVNGKLIRMPPTGAEPGRGGGKIYMSLYAYERRTKSGYAFPDNVGFLVKLPNRESFSPDAAYHIGRHTGMKFLEGAPTFAVEVRSEGDYGPQPERDMAARRADYFLAGTLAVWDVDLRGPDVIRKYTPDAPTTPTIYRRGELANAEPAVPGWTFDVDGLFD